MPSLPHPCPLPYRAPAGAQGVKVVQHKKETSRNEGSSPALTTTQTGTTTTGTATTTTTPPPNAYPTIGTADTPATTAATTGAATNAVV